MDPYTTALVAITGLIAAARGLRKADDGLTKDDFINWMNEHSLHEELAKIKQALPNFDITLQALIDDAEMRILVAIDGIKEHIDRKMAGHNPIPYFILGSTFHIPNEQLLGVMVGVTMADARSIVFSVADSGWEIANSSVDYMESGSGTCHHLRIYRRAAGWQFPVNINVQFYDAYGNKHDQALIIETPPPVRERRKYGIIGKIG